jgi:hypothetical protein
MSVDEEANGLDELALLCQAESTPLSPAVPNPDLAGEDEELDEPEFPEAVEQLMIPFFGASTKATGASANKSFKTARNHFDRFLQWLRSCKNGTPEQHQLVEALGEATTYEEIPKDKISFNLLDFYVTYLMEVKKVPKYETCNRYLAAIFSRTKEECERANKPGPNFDTKRIRRGMVKSYCEKAASDHKSLSEPHKKATDEDLKAMAALVYLFEGHEGPNLSVFIFLVLSSVQFAGRVTETSLVKLCNLQSKSVPEWIDAPPHEKIVECSFWRLKTTTEPNPFGIFCHRDNFLLDWYFAFAYSFVMRHNNEKEGNDCLFPGFYTEARKDSQSRQQNSSKVSSHASKSWSSIFQTVYSLSGELEDSATEILRKRGLPTVTPTKDLSSHCGKKAAVNSANENAFLKTTWVCFRAGWKMNMVHTIFDYLTPNPMNDRQVGRHLSGWRTVDATGGIGGGHPPLLQAVFDSTEEIPHKSKIFVFAAVLFHEYSPDVLEECLKHILCATLLRYLDDLVNLVEVLHQPEESLGGLPKHPFFEKLWDAAIGTEIPRQEVTFTLRKWCEVIRRDFLKRNFFFAPLHDITKFLNRSVFQVDHRSMASTLTGVYSGIQILQLENEELRTGHRNMSRRIDYLSRQVAELTRQLAEKTLQEAETSRQLAEILELLRTALQGAVAQQGTGLASLMPASAGSPLHNQTANPLPGGVRQEMASAVRFPKSLRGLTMPSIVRDVYKNEWYRIFSPKYRPRHDEPKTNGNTKSTIRKATEYLTLFMESHIAPLPETATNALSQEAADWRADLDRKVGEAWRAASLFIEKKSTLKSKWNCVSIGGFVKSMNEIDPLSWPNGPWGEGGNESYDYGNLRNADELRKSLVNHKACRQKSSKELTH